MEYLEKQCLEHNGMLFRQTMSLLNITVWNI